MKKHFLNEPDICQKEAINHCFGPCLVLAGPGCGKTTVITHHINFLVKHLNINPEHLQAVFEGMRAVTGDEGGTAHKVFSDFPIEVAGKTGTATSGNGSDNSGRFETYRRLLSLQTGAYRGE